MKKVNHKKQSPTPTILMLIGVLLLIAGAALLILNREASKQAENASATILKQLKESIAEQVPEESTEVPDDEYIYETDPDEVAALTIGGEGYVGYLTIPALSVEFPVTLSWRSDVLLPGRCSGTADSGNLVLACLDGMSDSVTAETLTPGNTVSFTDIYGNTHSYLVKTVEEYHIGELVVEDADAGDWDLTILIADTKENVQSAARCSENK